MSQLDSVYRRDIDGLRAIAVLVVLFFHAFPTRFPGGYVGVDIFFVISGYLISGIIIRGIDQSTFTYGDFYARRMRRIFPALVLVLSATLFCGWFLISAEAYKALAKQAVAGTVFISNFVLWRDAGYFDTSASTKPLLHLWSLGVEEQFYILWPLLLVLASRFRRWRFGLMAMLGFASFACSITLVEADATAAFYLPFTRFWELIIGALLAMRAVRKEQDSFKAYEVAERRVIAFKINQNLLSCAGLGLVLISVFHFDETALFPSWPALFPTLGAAMLIASGPGTWISKNVLSKRLAVSLGLISYPLYLWHWPVLVFAQIYELEQTPPAVIRAAGLVLSVLLAWLTFIAIERPIRFGPDKRRAVFGLSFAMLVVALAALAIYARDGVLDRAINQNNKVAFIRDYDNFHRHGLSAAYREECDFFDWKYVDNMMSLSARKRGIATSCVAQGSIKTVFLWGDSHAQALSYGLRAIAVPGTSIAQVATSGCKPNVIPINRATPGSACNGSNLFALTEIRRLRPETVIIAQAENHEETDWAKVADVLKKAGVRNIILIGPAPQWQPSLPLIIAANYWGASFTYVRVGLDQRIMATDLLLKASYRRMGIQYVSLIDQLCNVGGCLAVVPPINGRNLIAVDYGHLSPAGSLYVAKNILSGFVVGR